MVLIETISLFQSVEESAPGAVRCSDDDAKASSRHPELQNFRSTFVRATTSRRVTFGSKPTARAGITITPYDAIEGSQEAGLARLNRAIEARPFEVPIAAEYPLADAAKAHERQAAGHVLGKLLLRIR
jgi:NADPH:quinone reductase-like Zn-dependent oxidoreductase